ncbi:competence type IV pilus assembly protein ComGB [Staphylococcus gallinarum]|uniref:competence type IV pilus assembly protein ComGB n=7 Tax=Staphylococcus gallinarum TaxID=1293 RepID=UPI001E6219BA
MKKYLIAIVNKAICKSMNDKQRIDFVKRLNILLRHGFTLSESLTFLFEQVELKSSTLKQDLYASVKKGFGCSEIFAILKFPKSIIMLVYFSEIFGDLTLYLNNVEDFLLRNYKIKQNFYKTVQYPLVLLSFFIIMIMILNYTIIPEFKSLYLNMGVELSVLQITLTSIIFNLPLILLLIVIIISLIVILSICYYRSCSVAKKIQLISKLPILRKLFIRYKTYRLATEFSLFYKNGISLQSIVEIYANQESDPYLNYLSNIINLGLQKGLNLSDVLKETGCFEPGLIKFIKAGEKEGKLEIELKLYSEIIISKIEKQLQTIIKFIQPIIFVILAGLIVILYLVIMLPMFELMQTIK